MEVETQEYTIKSTVPTLDTLDLGRAGNVGGGLITYGLTAGAVDGYITLAYGSDGGFVSIAADNGFQLDGEDNPATVNIYTDVSGNIIIQNNTAASIYVSNALRGVLV